MWFIHGWTLTSPGKLEFPLSGQMGLLIEGIHSYAGMSSGDFLRQIGFTHWGAPFFGGGHVRYMYGWYFHFNNLRFNKLVSAPHVVLSFVPS